MSVFGQIGQRNQRPVFSRLSVAAQQITGIDPQKDMLPSVGKRSELEKDLAQSFCIYLPILKSFVQAGPFTLKQWRERQFGKTVRGRFTAQRVHRIKQRIARLLETAIHLVTKLVQYVKVHLSNAPFGVDTWNITRFGNPPQGWVAFLAPLV